MVETRRKKAAAAQDGTVKENKAEEPPALQPLSSSQQAHTPSKRGRRGRPPKIRPETSDPSTSSNGFHNEDSNDTKMSVDFDSQESCESLLTNEADSFMVKEDEEEDEEEEEEDFTTQSLLRRKTMSPEKQKIPPPPTLPKRRSSNKIKINISKTFMEPKEEIDPQQEEELYLVDSQPSTAGAGQNQEAEQEDEEEKEGERAEDEEEVINQEPEAYEDDSEAMEVDEVSSTSHDDVTAEAPPHPIESSPEPEPEEEAEQEPAEAEQVAGGVVLARSLSCGESMPDSESMDIADSESDCGDDGGEDEATSSMSPGREGYQQHESGQIHVDTAQETGQTAGLPSWERAEQSDSLTSPQRPIHFLHPAFQSFPRTEAPPEPAPLRETENGYVMGFKPMSLKTGKIGPKSNPLMRPSPLDTSSPRTSSVSQVSPKSTPSKRSSMFGEPVSSFVPPPQMVELPKLSFFNPPTPSHASSSSAIASHEAETSFEEKPVKKSIAPLPSPSPASSSSRYREEDKIQAVKAKAERVAQDIARRHGEERYKEERDDHDRRREERERRHREADEREKREEERKLREKERERELIKKGRLERAAARQELERKAEEERKRLEEEERAREEERRQKEDEQKRKEEEERRKADEMKVPEYELINECKFLIKCATKKKTESLLCDCARTGGNCSDNTCVNRAMNTECPSSCVSKCKNQRFSKRKYAAVEAYHTGTAKGCGLKALKDIKKGKFIIEYVGEVVERDDYEKRKMKYAADKKHTHHYLCDTGVYTIDATVYGNPSRFVNHSCEPNAVCERWSVPRTPGDVNRVGFFAKRNIEAGEEITFDYQFVNYGRDAQKCFCGAPACNGWIGVRPDFSSDEEEDDDLVTTRHINMDEEEEEKLEELEYLSPHERIELIDEMLADLIVTNKKYATKVITVASKMSDYLQRENLLKEIFSTDTSLGTQQFYAKEGMATLIGEWLYADDYSLGNLKLVQTALQALHNDVFVSCAKADPLLLEVLQRWMSASQDGWVDLHVVTNSIVTCVAEPEKLYSDVCEDTEREITENFNRVKEMAFRLNHHWFNRSVSFKIPKKIREPEKKESDHKATSSGPDRSASPPYQRHHHSSSYAERESHPRFFNNGNDVHQYRFGGYHGNNYLANYNRRTPYRDSYRDRRRFRRSRSRTRSPSPQLYKRRKMEEREGRHRSPTYERRGGSPGTRSRTQSPERSKADKPTSSASVPEDSSAVPTAEQYDPAVHGIQAVQYQMAGYEQYGMYDPTTGMYVYPNYYQTTQQYAQIPGAYGIESLPPNQRLRELYETSSVEQLVGRLAQVQEDVQQIQMILTRKQAELIAIETARREAEEEARRRAEEDEKSRKKYTWAQAFCKESGEIYYYNKNTKQTQWTLPKEGEGLVDPVLILPEGYVVKKRNDGTSVVVHISTLTEAEVAALDPPQTSSSSSNAYRHEPPVDRSERTPPASDEHRSRRKEREKERERERRDSSRQKESLPHVPRASDSSRVREFKVDFERIVRSAVKAACRDVRNATSEKISWMVKMLTKDLYKRETTRPDFDFRMSESTEKKIRNYTKSLIDRKLKTDDLWKGFSDR